MLLRDLGARVIKVEPPEGDYLRWMPPLRDGENILFRVLARGKESVVLDLRSREGRAALRELIGAADVLVEGFRPGVMDRLGLGYEAVSRWKGDIIYCSISSYGSTGPYRERAGHDLNFLALSGLLDLMNPGEGGPVIPPLLVGDVAGGGLTAVLAILAAVIRRDRTGEGSYLDISMTHGLIFAGLWPLVYYLATGSSPDREDLRLCGSLACYSVYETADGRYMALAALEPKFWRAFCGAVGAPDLIDRQFDPDQREVRARLAEVFRSRTAAEWEEMAATGDFCLERVLTISEACRHPQAVARGLCPGDGAPANPVRRYRPGPSGAPEAARAPALGEHTSAVLGEFGIGRERDARGGYSGCGEDAHGKEGGSA